jgi:hypothetical protein
MSCAGPSSRLQTSKMWFLTESQKEDPSGPSSKAWRILERTTRSKRRRDGCPLKKGAIEEILRKEDEISDRGQVVEVVQRQVKP